MSRHCTQCNISVAIGTTINPICYGTTPHNLVDDAPPQQTQGNYYYLNILIKYNLFVVIDI